MSKIEWCTHTWNPIAGCRRVSPGCQRCYAESMARRLQTMGHQKYAGTVDPATGRWTGVVREDRAALDQPRTWRKPRVVFVNSMSDLFQDILVDERPRGGRPTMLQEIYRAMLDAPRHQFLVLTKRPEGLARWLDAEPCPALELSRAGHIWHGVSVESQAYVARARYLARLNLPRKFLSVEPLLGPVDLDPQTLARMDWVIVGGESGPGARPMHPLWAERIRVGCAAAGVPWFFKQWGEWAPSNPERYRASRQEWISDSGPGMDGITTLVCRVGKAAAGRLYDRVPGAYGDEIPDQLRPLLRPEAQAAETTTTTETA